MRTENWCGVTRGDGVQGDDVTGNVKTIRSIPLVLHGKGYPETFEIRGEILMPWVVFEELNKEREAREEPLFANRNALSGNIEVAEFCYCGISQAGCLPLLFTWR